MVDPDRALWVPNRKTWFLPATTTLTAAGPATPTTIPVTTVDFAEDRQVGIRMRFLKEYDITPGPTHRLDFFNPKADLATQYREGVLIRPIDGLDWFTPPYGYSPEAKAAWDAEIKRCARQMADRIDAELVAQIYCVHGLDATEASKHRMGVIADVRA